MKRTMAHKKRLGLRPKESQVSEPKAREAPSKPTTVTEAFSKTAAILSLPASLASITQPSSPSTPAEVASRGLPDPEPSPGESQGGSTLKIGRLPKTFLRKA